MYVCVCCVGLCMWVRGQPQMPQDPTISMSRVLGLKVCHLSSSQPNRSLFIKCRFWSRTQILMLSRWTLTILSLQPQCFFGFVFEAKTQIAQADIEVFLHSTGWPWIRILLLLPPKYWGYRCPSLCPADLGSLDPGKLRIFTLHTFHTDLWPYCSDEPGQHRSSWAPLYWSPQLRPVISACSRPPSVLVKRVTGSHLWGKVGVRWDPRLSSFPTWQQRQDSAKTWRRAEPRDGRIPGPWMTSWNTADYSRGEDKPLLCCLSDWRAGLYGS